MSAISRYLRAWTLATLLLLAAVAAINLLVDPYDIFRAVDADGFNRIKSQASQRTQLFKRTNVERMRPNALILGNSRAEVGFDPDSRAWPDAARPVFNLAAPGSGPMDALAEFQRVETFGDPKLLLVGVDFVDFRTDSSKRSDPAPASAPPESRWKIVRDRLSALLTTDALIDSLSTIKAQRDSNSPRLTTAGFNPMRDYVVIAGREGYYSMFRQRNQENARNYARGYKSIYRADGRPAPEFDAIARLLSAAHKRNVAVRLIIYPYHAQTLVLFHQAGLWDAFEDWKLELVKVVQSAPAGADVELWDFSGFAPYADERVPAPEDTASKLRWYWEAGHFKSALGDLALARIFDKRADDDPWGRRLSPSTIAAQLAELRAARDDYERAHPAEVADLATLVSGAARR